MFGTLLTVLSQPVPDVMDDGDPLPPSEVERATTLRAGVKRLTAA
jgi:hypothetical protein